MFGYIRPRYGELRVKEMEAYKACYCGLCRCLGREYGLTARFILNYDFVLLVMLLWPEGLGAEFSDFRCPVKLCRKRKFCRAVAQTEVSAAMSVILAYHKLSDDIADSGPVRALGARIARALLKRPYKKAAARLPDFDVQVREKLTALSAMEKAGERSIDKTADCFAQLLAAASCGEQQEDKQRILRELLYHVGRFIYIADACDDLREDAEKGEYNPVCARFAITDGALTADARKDLETTMLHSRNLAGVAFELLDPTPWSETVRNILYFGLYDTIQDVLKEGTVNSTKRTIRT